MSYNTPAPAHDWKETDGNGQKASAWLLSWALCIAWPFPALSTLFRDWHLSDCFQAEVIPGCIHVELADRSYIAVSYVLYKDLVCEPMWA